jgi:hypothetical protein
MDKKPNGQEKSSEQPTHQVHLPGWLMKEQEEGLGNVMKRVTYRFGLKHCKGCAKRADALNHWIVFSRR